MTDSTSITRTTPLQNYRNISSVEDHPFLVLGIAVLPVPLATVFFIVHSWITGTPASAYSMPMGYLMYGLVNAFVVGVLYALLTPEERTRILAFERPSLYEIGAACVAFVAGLGVYQATAWVNSMLGFQLQGMSYPLTDWTALTAIIIGTVVLAPLTEEILYRGLILKTLTSRGFGSVSAVVLMTAIFALIHLPNFGVAGTIFISVWGLLPAWMRLRFDNLSGAVLMHAMNNFFAYVVVAAAGWT